MKFGDVHEGLLANKNLYNDKELFDDADLNWYDYGFRNYDPQIGRFPQLDPLTWDYPELTNYQYASNDPIANVDMDGLEGGSALSAIPTGAMAAEKTLAPVVFKVTLKAAPKVASAGASVITKLSLITAKGVSDALLNANTLGLSDAFGNNHLSSYDDTYEQAAYLRGRLGGDAIATAQGSQEVNGGIGAALATGGVGAVGGLVVGLHGAGVGGTAAYDAAWAVKKLYQLNISAAAESSVSNLSSTSGSGETSSTKRGREAHDNYNPGKKYTTTRRLNRLLGGKLFPDAIDMQNRIVRELKPNNIRAIKLGTNQVEKYKQVLEKITGVKWKSAVDTYDVNPDGTFQYNFGTPK